MRVRIQYSVDLDEIPSKISGFLKNVCNDLKNQSDTLTTIAAELNKNTATRDCLAEIDAVRQEMAILDSILADGHAILGGYLNALEGPEDPLELEVPDVIPEG